MCFLIGNLATTTATHTQKKTSEQSIKWKRSVNANVKCKMWIAKMVKWYGESGEKAFWIGGMQREEIVKANSRIKWSDGSFGMILQIKAFRGKIRNGERFIMLSSFYRTLRAYTASNKNSLKTLPQTYCTHVSCILDSFFGWAAGSPGGGRGEGLKKECALAKLRRTRCERWIWNSHRHSDNSCGTSFLSSLSVKCNMTHTKETSKQLQASTTHKPFTDISRREEDTKTFARMERKVLWAPFNREATMALPILKEATRLNEAKSPRMEKKNIRKARARAKRREREEKESSFKYTLSWIECVA